MKSTSVISLIILIIISISLISIPIFYYRYTFGSVISPNKAEWGMFGDFMNFFVSTANLLITAAIAWFVYEFQNKNNKESEINKLNVEENNRIKYLNKLFKRAIDFGNKTVLSLEDYIISMEKDKKTIPIFSAYSVSELRTVVKDINRDQYYHAYENQVKRDNLFEVFAPFDVLYSNYRKLVKTLESFQKNDNRRMVENQKIIESLIDEIVVHLGKLKFEQKRDSTEFKVFNNAILMYYEIVQKDPSDIFSMRASLYKPILEYLVGGSKQHEERYSKLALLTSKANKALTPVEGGRDRYIQNLTHLKNLLQDNIKGAKDLTEKINNYIEGSSS